MCEECLAGWVFEDARGGHECSACDQRYLINRDYPLGYGGPGGVLSWFERFRWWLAQLIWPRTVKHPPDPEERDWLSGLPEDQKPAAMAEEKL